MKKYFCKICNKEITNGSKLGFCQSCSHKGKKPGNYKGGKPRCSDCGKILSTYKCKKCVICSNRKFKNRIGKLNPMFGRKHSIEAKNSMKIKRKGKKSSSWKGGISSLGVMIHNLDEYKLWREKVFKRDEYTCQECFRRGGNLEVHHDKKSFSILLQEFLQTYSQFSPIEDKETLVRLAITYEPFWDVNNGETLCENCHKLTPNYKNKKRINGFYVLNNVKHYDVQSQDLLF